jgi:four helix bundle protein
MMPYERIKAWELCHQLVLAVYRSTSSWPKQETYGLVSQARRAAYSAAANIAEGAAKQGAREFRRFLDSSVGSLNELSYIFRLAKDLALSSESEIGVLEELRSSAGKTTWGLYDAIKKKGQR